MRRATTILLGLALAGCGGGGEPRRAATPTPTATQDPRGQVVLATKNFTEQYVLGHVYAQALEARGFDIELEENVGSSEIVDQALQIGVVDMYLEYMGVIAGELAGGSSADRPRTPDRTYRRASRFQRSRGFEILERMPIPIPERFQALEDGDVDSIDVFTTEARPADGDVVTLLDPEGIFGFQNIVPVVEQEVLRRQGPEFRRTVDAVSAKLTNRRLRQLNGAVDLDGREPAEVAREFLVEEGLL